MAQVILVALAAMLNAFMDTVGDSVHFNGSIFSKLDPKFWSKDVSWQYATKVFGWKADAWHIAKSGMVVLLVFAMLLPNGWNFWLKFIVLGSTWNIFFNIFYSVFKR